MNFKDIYTLMLGAGDSLGVVQEIHPTGAGDSLGGGAGDSPRTYHSLEPINKPLVTPKRDKKNFNFNQDHFNFAQAMFEKIKNVAPASKEPNLESWANTIRLLCESDEININYAWNVFKFANSDPFWQTNILSADKFRKQFAQLSAKMPAPQKQRTIKDFKV